MKRTLPILISTLCLASGLPAAPITLTNFSFELPGTGKILGWDTAGNDIPGWTSQIAPTNSTDVILQDDATVYRVQLCATGPSRLLGFPEPKLMGQPG